MNFGVLTVPLGNVEPMVRQTLAASVQKDPCESLDDVIAAVEDGRALCWAISDEVALRGVVVTEIVEGSKARQCFIRHCAGEGIRDWLHFLNVIEAWAASDGCDTIELIGREGWERLLGWERKAVLLRKDLH